MYDVKKLKQLRKINQYSIYDMGKKLNISSSYYSQIENKKRRLYYDMAVNIASIFDLKPDDIFYIKRY